MPRIVPATAVGRYRDDLGIRELAAHAYRHRVHAAAEHVTEERDQLHYRVEHLHWRDRDVHVERAVHPIDRAACDHVERLGIEHHFVELDHSACQLAGGFELVISEPSPAQVQFFATQQLACVDQVEHLGQPAQAIDAPVAGHAVEGASDPLRQLQVRTGGGEVGIGVQAAGDDGMLLGKA